LISAYTNFVQINKKDYFSKLAYECLLNREKTEHFVSVIERFYQ